MKRTLIVFRDLFSIRKAIFPYAAILFYYHYMDSIKFAPAYKHLILVWRGETEARTVLTVSM